MTGKQLRAEMDRQQIPIRALAEALHTEVSTITRWRVGRHRIPLSVAYALAHFADHGCLEDGGCLG